MRVIVEVGSGPLAGTKISLGAGQVLQVGRTEWADFALPHDKRLSAVHFALETSHAACYIKDLGSSNGTFINGRRIEARTVLRHADKISAGQTVFAVRIEGDGPQEMAACVGATSLSGDAASVTSGPADRPASQPRTAATYTVQECISGLTLCRGEAAEIAPADLGLLLSKKIPLYAIVDPHKLDDPLPAQSPAVAYLLDWLPEESRTKLSPVIVSPSEETSPHALLGSAWGKDAVIGVFSAAEKNRAPGQPPSGGRIVRAAEHPVAPTRRGGPGVHEPPVGERSGFVARGSLAGAVAIVRPRRPGGTLERCRPGEEERLRG